MVSNYRGRKLSAEPIRELTRCEVFVFGSNLEGKHRGGAAGYACRHFGATYGQGVGPQGQCYAIPTMFETVGEMVPYVQEFIEYVKDHPMNRFLITRLGCGVAGFKDQKGATPSFLYRGVSMWLLPPSYEITSPFVRIDELLSLVQTGSYTVAPDS